MSVKVRGKRLGQTATRETIGRLMHWPAMKQPVEGYSIILGVPWMLRHVLSVNLRAISRCDLSRVVDIHVILDRPEKPGMRAYIAEHTKAWPDLPLRFSWQPRATGSICERVNVSTFYNGLNILTALSQCRARAAVLHDFDLYPLRADYFEKLGARILDDGLRFAGLERTVYDGLREDDDIYGTWGLSMDAAWLRNDRRPGEILHRQERLDDGRLIRLDPFSWMQLSEPKRGGVEGMTPADVCHVKNLCSTYLRLQSRQPVHVAWRLHYLAYLEDVSAGTEERMRDTIAQMKAAPERIITMYGQEVDFTGVHWTCGNVLRREIFKLDEFLHGGVRPGVQEFADVSAEFMLRGGTD